MPFAGRPPDLRRAIQEALRVATMWNIACAKQVVSHQGRRGYHSKPGHPLFRQSGRGQASIDAQLGKDEAKIGAFLSGFNYMSAWGRGMKTGERPWLKFVMSGRYRAETERLVKRMLQFSLGAR